MNNQETVDIIFKQLDLIEKTIKDIAETWKITNIPVNTIEMTINKGKIDVKKLPRKDRRNDNVITFYNEYNKLLDSIIAESKKDASEMGTTSIPLALFENYIDIVKGGLIAGAKNIP